MSSFEKQEVKFEKNESPFIKTKSFNFFPDSQHKITTMIQIYNNIFAIGTELGTVVIFDVQNMEKIYEHQILLNTNNYYPISSICKINDNSLACSFLGSGTVAILDLSGDGIQYLEECNANDITYIKNLVLITYNVIIGSYKNYIYMWNISTKKYIHKIIIDDKSDISSMILSKSVLYVSI